MNRVTGNKFSRMKNLDLKKKKIESELQNKTKYQFQNKRESHFQNKTKSQF